MNYNLKELISHIGQATFLGYNDQGLCKALKYFFVKSFPDKCQFEKSDITDRIVEISKWLDSERNYEQGVDLFAKYLRGANLLKMFRDGETAGLRKKLEFKLERVLYEI
jgi:hypothetical protein